MSNLSGSVLYTTSGSSISALFDPEVMVSDNTEHHI